MIRLVRRKIKKNGMTYEKDVLQYEEVCASMSDNGGIDHMNRYWIDVPLVDEETGEEINPVEKINPVEELAPKYWGPKKN